jgi:predicted nucleotidyltransferase
MEHTVMEKDLNQLVEKLKSAAGTNLKTVVLYGSAVAGDFHPKHSNLNILCLVERAGATELESLNPVAVWWVRKGHPAPLIFTLDELRRSADVFAIELLDIKQHHRILHGDDSLISLEVPMVLHGLQVERELRVDSIRLREAILTAPRSRRALMNLMLASVSSFVTLFRHALIVLGEQPPHGKRAIVARASAVFGASAVAFDTVLDVREGKQKQSQVDVAATLRGYLELVVRVADAVDHKLARGG